MHPVLLSDEDLLAECEVTRLRRGGPGGQHRNKVETAVRIEHKPSGTIAEANETRSQERNRREAIIRLRLKLAFQIRSEIERDDALHQAWAKQLRGGRVTATAHAGTGPLLVAHVFNVLEIHQYDLKPAAARLDTTVSQLTKFLSSDSSAWSEVNRQREQAGRHPLRR